MENDNKNHKLGRREFLGGAAAAAGFMIIKPEQVRGTAANSAVRMGVLGCGGRGTAVASGFIDSTNTRIVALADLWGDQLAAGQKHFDDLQRAKGYSPIDSSQLFKGPRSYERIVDSKEVDFVLITTPPYFHPGHLEAVVDAGKHVYCEKPVAVDVVGAKRVMRIGEKAQGKLSLDVGFQIRNAPPFVEMVRRIHAGALGKIGCGLAYYYCPHIDRPEWPGSADEKRLRNWVWDRTLSGDIIVEQNVHVIDICNWILQSHPVKAVGGGSRKLREDAGNCYDNFNLVFTYPGDVQVSFGSTQFDKHEFDAAVRFFGTRGSCEAHYDHRMSIAGEEKWDAGLGGAAQGGGQFSAAGTFKGSLDQADPEKQRAFIASIVNHEFHNQAAQGVETALTGMLGRTAAYTGKLVTWDELLSSNEGWDAKIDLSKLG